VTRYWWGPFEVNKEMYGPAVLLIDHAKHGRTILDLDRKAPIPGAEARTWRLDLGTVLIPEE
jgi:hypothetical protein